jgi:hypothetical protein
MKLILIYCPCIDVLSGSPHVWRNEPIARPSHRSQPITPISEQLEGVIGDRAAATVKADDRILEKLSKLMDAKAVPASQQWRQP